MSQDFGIKDVGTQFWSQDYYRTYGELAELRREIGEPKSEVREDFVTD